MFKIVNEKDKTNEIIKMGDMEPLDIAIIEGEDCKGGKIVMRTASQKHFEVINLSNPGSDRCWEARNNLKVSLLKKRNHHNIRGDIK